QDIQPLTGRKKRLRPGHRRRQVAAVRSDLYERLPVRQAQVVKTSVGAIDDAKSVLAAFYLEVRPHFAVDQDRIAKVFGVPIRVDPGVVAHLSKMDRAIRIECPIHYEERNLEPPLRKERGNVVIRVTNDVRALKSGGNIQPGHPQGVI